MFFLVNFDRTNAHLDLQTFASHEEAARALDAAAKEYPDQTQREIAIFESQDENTFRRTHNRYFEDPVEIVRRIGRTLNR